LQALLKLAAGIDRVSWVFGIIASVLVLAACLISAGNAVSRYAFDLSSNAWLEIQWQLFSGIFLLGAPWVLKLNGHVRVDLVYGSVNDRKKLWIDIFGLIFFLGPATAMMIYFGWPWFLNSLAQNEQSANAGGLLFWPVKGLLPLGFLLLFLQGVAELIKRVAALVGHGAVDLTYEKPTQ
jgi:TRAP-type mannitol/chloroaromatic compound transport system permease small subunit